MQASEILKREVRSFDFSYIPGVIIDIVQSEDFYSLRLYRNNFNPDHYSVDIRRRFLIDLNGLLERINNNLGIACYLEIFGAQDEL